MSEVKVVLFDAAGVLFPLNRVVGEALARRFNLSEDELLPMWQGIYKQYSAGELATAQFLRAFADMFKLSPAKVTRTVFVESFLRHFEPMPGMEDLMAKLGKTDITIAMLSNTVEMFAQARRNSPFSPYFDRMFLSFEIGYRKPDPRAYQVVIDHYKVKPSEVFFIDDSPRNNEAAIALSMQAHTFTTAADLETALKAAGVLKF